MAITSLNFNFQVGAIQKDELKHGRIALNKKNTSQRFFFKGLLETSDRLAVCISCLGLEEKGTYKRLLAERSKAMLSHVTEWIRFVEFL